MISVTTRTTSSTDSFPDSTQSLQYFKEVTSNLGMLNNYNSFRPWMIFCFLLVTRTIMQDRREYERLRARIESDDGLYLGVLWQMKEEETERGRENCTHLKKFKTMEEHKIGKRKSQGCAS